MRSQYWKSPSPCQFTMTIQTLLWSLVSEMVRCKLIKRNLADKAFCYCPEFHKKYSEVDSYHNINIVVTKSKVKSGKTTILDIISLDILTLLKESDAPTVLRELVDNIEKLLIIILERLWRSREVPQDWKEGDVTPVFNKRQEGVSKELLTHQPHLNPWECDGVPYHIYSQGWQEGDHE